jgi:hypothetical protein
MEEGMSDGRMVVLNRQEPRFPACGETIPAEVRGSLGIEEYADRIAEELHERVDHQRRVLRQLLVDGAGSPDRQAYCPLVDCTRLSRLQEALRETIEVLEETRSSFKSKRLEVMRRKLVEILAGG